MFDILYEVFHKTYVSVKTYNLHLFAILIHILFLLSVFDIYFQSPVISGINQLNNNAKVPAKRLVLFVGDGLRADKFFEKANENSPYLRKIIEKVGSWGISHTRVPTESRPGHIAIIAGLYEDPSAVFKGWKENPVEFDHVFNQSFATYAWGSPDILHLFSNSHNKNIFNFMYSEKLQDFSGHNESSVYLNNWVLEEFKVFMDTAKQNKTLFNIINKDKVIFFMHFLGIDVAGHASKPNSEDYRNNIQITDNCIKEIVEIVEKFFLDQKTAYVFTSDHGMTDWGSHGAGSTVETETPIIAWGAGISKPIICNLCNDSPWDWKLNNYKRRDVNQADLAPFLSSLIGISIPVNSVGIIPLMYLNFDKKNIASTVLLNAQQLIVLFNKKQEIIYKSTPSYFYYPFEELSSLNQYNSERLISQIFSTGNYSAIIDISQNLITRSLLGITYYERYHENIALLIVSIMYTGWIARLIVFLIKSTLKSNKLIGTFYEQNNLKRLEFYIYISNVFFFILFLCITTLVSFCASVLSCRYFIYTWTAVELWRQSFQELIKIHYSLTLKISRYFILACIKIILCLEFFKFSFSERRVITVTTLCIIIWFSVERLKKKINIIWFLSSLIIIVCPLLPTIGTYRNLNLVFVVGFIWLLFHIYDKRVNILYNFRSLFSVCIMFISITNIIIIDVNLNLQKGLPIFNQICSWCVLSASLYLIYSGHKYADYDFKHISFNLANFYILFSISYEFLLLFALTVHYSILINLEEKRKSSNMYLGSIFYVNYLLLSFFGTGNISSINSFDTQSIRCFLTVFSPITMMMLILLKIITPFFLTTVAFRFIISSSQKKININYIFTIILLYCDYMSFRFLFSVTNVGSWLEIGLSLSNFIVMESIVFFILILYFCTLFVTKSYNASYSYCKEI